MALKTKRKKIKILLVGYGHLAHSVYRALKTSCELQRESVSNKILASDDFIPDVIWILKKDNLFYQEVSRLKKRFPDALYISSSAAVDIQKVKRVQVATLYPLGTFRKERPRISFRNVPIMVEYGIGLKAFQKKRIRRIVQALKGKPYFLSYNERIKLHIAAVFANNFTNALWVASLDYAGRHKNLLRPIMAETLENLKTYHPENHQTGPALRKDQFTLRAHRAILRNNKNLGKIYDAVTEYIIQRFVKS